MSILIKGVDMMREGQVLVIDSTGQVWSNEWPTRGYIKIDKATAVPVPTPHGRLIDADALAAQCDDPYWCVWLNEIEDAPTIIEAEE